MCQWEARCPALISFLTVIATVLTVAQGQQHKMFLTVDQSQPPQRLPPDYVKGVLSLKSRLLSNKPVLGYSANHLVGGNPVPVLGIRPDMRYSPQLEVQQSQSPQGQPLQEIQVEPVASLRPSLLAHRPSVHSQMPSVKLNRYSQEFPPAHLFQPPFVPMPKKQEAQDPPPTAEQLELLQQLSQFFGQRQPGQQQVQSQESVVVKCAQENGEDGGQCGTETTTECCENTKEPNRNAEKDSITVDVKNKEQEVTTTSTTAAPKPPVTAKQTNATKPSTTQKPATTQATKLPCCKKQKIQGIDESPNVISFSLNIQNDKAEQTKSLQQMPRSGRHVIQPDLRINALTNLLRYRRKSAKDVALYAKPLSSLKDQELQVRSRVKRKKDKIIDKKQLLQAELKIWPISVRSKMVERLH
ncbi:uncharacterized protein LOC108102733 [Drosophila eugracilis]|uniref:uncharacterized protein LOC108102733 n=1 Tax=Drosophila eugracilis TaxID=29029 RepID=UPI0007E7ECD8|nr:uncharacterized protein LOC108102733 [Drosophila eugracilis]